MKRSLALTFASLSASAVLTLAPVLAAGAQCSDGSPPPCRAVAVASNVTRRADAPIDPKTWIIVPFDNLNNNQDIDWLRTGAVNLMYIGMSRWTDIRVIDDERVADYMREVPGATGAKSLSAGQAIAIAKRAGAAQVVMGDLLKLGNRTTINAKVYDVRTGQRIRSVREESNNPDSLMAVFGKLSQKTLNIPVPVGAASAVVTNSIAAYREYAEGMAALNQFDLVRAQALLNKALELDSTFALAHAKLAVLMGWTAPSSTAGRQHAEAAMRLSGSLPPRERALIQASVAFARGQYVESCDGFRGLIRNDSTDTDAWYGLGDCLYHDPAILPTDGDSTRPRWRANRNESLRAFRQALVLDPTYHLAYQHLVDMYSTVQLIGAQSPWCPGGKCVQVIMVPRPSADSLLLTPLMLPRDSTQFRQHLDDYTRTGARRQLVAEGKRLAQQWVAANPSEERARLMFATVLNAAGDVAAADTLLRRAAMPDTGQGGTAASLLRLELSLKQWQGARAHQLFDSIRTHGFYLGRSPLGATTTGNVVVLATPVFGQASLYDSLIAVGIRITGAPASRAALSRIVTRRAMGIPVDSAVAVIASVYAEVAATSGPMGGTATATRGFGPFLGFELRGPTDAWPRLDTTNTDPRTAPAIAVQRKDTAALRRAALRLDSTSALYARSLVPDTGAALIGAEAFLVLRDSLHALQLTRRWLDSIMVYTPMISGQTGQTYVHQLAPRAAVMRADLASALGLKDEARLWYDRFLAMVTTPDADFAPVVERVRKARAALSP